MPALKRVATIRTFSAQGQTDVEMGVSPDADAAAGEHFSTWPTAS